MTHTTSPIRRPLSSAEMSTILHAIDTADSSDALTAVTIVSVLNTLLADDGRSLENLAPGEQINPGAWEIPTRQWHAITAAAINRAQQWGTSAHLSMELVNRMPASYDDPTAPVPDHPTKDWRPDRLEVHLTRDATDTISAATKHLNNIGVHFGPTSPQYLDAARSWLTAMSTLLSMSMGAKTVVYRDGALSLAVRTAGGIHYGLIFHGVPRVCATGDGCGAHITDDGTASPAWSGAFVAGHDHQPSYPLDAPQPGQWSFHS